MHFLASKVDLLHEFNDRNKAASADEIYIRNHIRIRTVDEARYAYEHFCHINPEMTRELDSFLHFSRFRKRLLDVGCLFGIFSFSFCAKDARKSLAIDPSPSALKILRANCQINLSADIVVYDCAAGDQETTIYMEHEWKHLVAVKSSGPTSMPVRCRTCDSIVADMRFSPDIVKIDVEGYENHVLRGMEGLIKRNRPDIHIETHAKGLREQGSSIYEIFVVLRESNYRVYDMSGTEIITYEHSAKDQVNWYCTHRFGDTGGRLP